MPSTVKKIRVFVASPGDVQDEREQLVKVIEELNLIISAIAPEKAIVLELVRWESHVFPTMGKDAQDVINQQIGEYDIFIGILWKRMGTPTTTASSGTIEEFNGAYDRWKKDNSIPLLLYFCQEVFAPPRSIDEVDQLKQVISFRAEVSQKGLVKEFASHKGFADVVRPQLLFAIARMNSAKDEQKGVARTTAVDTSVIKKQFITIAGEYEQLRATMQPGPERTQQMEICVSKMSSISIPGYPLLKEFSESERPGLRLAAVVMLKSIPDADYIHWLSRRLFEEKPFIGYHAAIALLNASRSLHAVAGEELHHTLTSTMHDLIAKEGESFRYTERFVLLQEAEKELRGKRGG